MIREERAKERGRSEWRGKSEEFHSQYMQLAVMLPLRRERRRERGEEKRRGQARKE